METARLKAWTFLALKPPGISAPNQEPPFLLAHIQAKVINQLEYRHDSEIYISLTYNTYTTLNRCQENWKKISGGQMIPFFSFLFTSI